MQTHACHIQGEKNRGGPVGFPVERSCIAISKSQSAVSPQVDQ